MELFRLLILLYITMQTANAQRHPNFGLDLNAWWGPEERKYQNDTSIRPFKINFDDQMIADLKNRLYNHRRPAPPLEGVAFEYGFNSDVLGSWLQYWAETYPFKQREQFLNKYPQYLTNIQGLDIHFIKYGQKVYENQEIVPIILLHGWPGSIREFYETIPYLTANSMRRDFAVEVIVPSLPGFGFSDSAVRPGLGANEMAVVLRNLMKRLGYQKYYVQGGDWGAAIGATIATLFPNEVLGYHTNFGVALTRRALALILLGTVNPSAVVEAALANRLYPLTPKLVKFITESGYLHLQATKPDTIGIAMTDSPGGLMAHLLQVISSATRGNFVNLKDGGLDQYYTRDQLLDNIMMYWVPNSITTSFRIYAESVNRRALYSGIAGTPTPVPTCTIHAKDEIAYQSPAMLRTKYPNLLNSTNLETGGHFLALEIPELFARNVLDCISEIRSWYATRNVYGK